ncbi:ABC transporter substrate-binding protein [Tistrella mobilis]|uniref:ABC transporter substrate-binding protein n=1 Tax=Tistrella mobilis TaxID=171437 RepID=UPI003558F095
MIILRKLKAAAAAVALVVATAGMAVADPITVTDVAGREVTIPAPAKRLLLGEGRDLVTLSVVHPDPVSVLAGWLGDLRLLDTDTYDRFKAAYPAIERVPLVGSTNEESFSIEKALSVAPDLAVLGFAGHGPSPRSKEVIDRLTEAGIPIVFIDFRGKPLENTIPSLEILGKVLGQEERVARYIDFYRARLELVKSRVAASTAPRPKVLVDMRPTMDGGCCGSPGKGNLGEFVDLAGGHNIGADVLPGPLGQLDAEYVLTQDPAVYIATGTAGGAETGGIQMGAGIDPAVTRESLDRLAHRPVVGDLSAVRDGRVYALWHSFYNSPLNIVAVEAIAKWVRPDLFADLDPDAVLADINGTFLPVSLDGSYAVALKPE